MATRFRDIAKKIASEVGVGTDDVIACQKALWRYIINRLVEDDVVHPWNIFEMKITRRKVGKSKLNSGCRPRKEVYVRGRMGRPVEQRIDRRIKERKASGEDTMGDVLTKHCRLYVRKHPEEYDEQTVREAENTWQSVGGRKYNSGVFKANQEEEH